MWAPYLPMALSEASRREEEKFDQEVERRERAKVLACKALHGPACNCHSATAASVNEAK